MADKTGRMNVRLKAENMEKLVKVKGAIETRTGKHQSMESTIVELIESYNKEQGK